MKKILIPPVFLILSLILIVLFYFLLPSFNLIPFPYNYGGIIILSTGFVIMGKTRDLFRKYKTTLGFDQSSHLIKEGVFTKSRNPMYLGMFLLLLGWAVCFMNFFSILIAFDFLLLVNLIFIPKEEQLLEEEFGQEYLDYKNKVKRWV